MSNGYLLASGPDLAAAREISVGFGLEVIDAANVTDPAALGEALARAANVGLLISTAAARDPRFVALLRGLAARLQTPQLILADRDAHTPFAFLPAQWPAMLLDDARARATRRRDAPAAAPPPPSGDALADLLRSVAKPDPAPRQQPPETIAPEPPAPAPPPSGDAFADLLRSVTKPDPEPPPAPQPAPEQNARAIVRRQAEAETDNTEAETSPPMAEPSPASESLAHEEAEFAPLPQESARAAPPAKRETAPADATAFAPKKLRRGTPELVRVVIHQPSQARAVIKAAKQIDPAARPAPQGMSIGDIALGANVGIALEVRGGACEGALQRRAWAGEPLDFAFPIEVDDTSKQAIFLARVFVDDAQIGVLAFTRPIVGAKNMADSAEVRLTRHKRVFISYSSADRETVAIIATAYQMAGVQHFWDRTALKSGEEWSPRLKREIERADLFHLCWSKAAAQSDWVAKEAAHALKRRRGAKRPEITVQMLDGPPWAPHPPELAAINFDDFVRAAIVGYARGEA